MEKNEQLVLTEETVVTSDQLMQTDEVVINQSNVSIHDNFPTQTLRNIVGSGKINNFFNVKKARGRPRKAEKALVFSKENMSLYCFCNGPDYGKMVECENERCERGWFHFKCVNLQTSPRGSWLCSVCNQSN